MRFENIFNITQGIIGLQIWHIEEMKTLYTNNVAKYNGRCCVGGFVVLKYTRRYKKRKNIHLISSYLMDL